MTQDKTEIEKQRPFKEEPTQYEDGTVRLGEDWDDEWVSCNNPAHAKLQAKVQELEKENTELNDMIDNDLDIVIQNATKKIDDLQAELSALKEQSRWIPVAERLPDFQEYQERKQYWVRLERRDKPEYFYFDALPYAGTIGGKPCWPQGEVSLYEVTHWQEITPPKPEEV